MKSLYQRFQLLTQNMINYWEKRLFAVYSQYLKARTFILKYKILVNVIFSTHIRPTLACSCKHLFQVSMVNFELRQLKRCVHKSPSLKNYGASLGKRFKCHREMSRQGNPPEQTHCQLDNQKPDEEMRKRSCSSSSFKWLTELKVHSLLYPNSS